MEQAVDILKSFWDVISQGFSGIAFLILMLSSFFAYMYANIFVKIIYKEMERGGEEYGEIASTKILSKAILFKILAIIGFAFTIVIAIALAWSRIS